MSSTTLAQFDPFLASLDDRAELVAESMEITMQRPGVGAGFEGHRSVESILKRESAN